MIPLTKVGAAYVADDAGELKFVPEHDLHSWECLCGQHSGVWYASFERTERSFARHLDRVT